jgi:hypothetical protein
MQEQAIVRGFTDRTYLVRFLIQAAYAAYT